jgi:hypothetical protein
MKKKRLESIENEILRLCRDVAVLQEKSRTVPMIGRVCAELAAYTRPDGLTDDQWDMFAAGLGAALDRLRALSGIEQLDPLAGIRASARWAAEAREPAPVEG